MSESFSKAMIGKGTTFAYSEIDAEFNPTGEYTNFSEAYDAGLPGVTVADVDVTHYLSPNGQTEEIPGWKTGDEVPLTMNYTQEGYEFAAGIVGIKGSFQVTLPNGDTMTFLGYLKKFGGKIPNKDKIINDVSVKVAGPIDYVAAS